MSDIEALFQTITPRYPELAGRVAVVTGSSRGIGQGIALRLAREGMRLVINGRTPETVEAMAQALRGLGVEAIGVAADLAQSESVHRLFDETLAAYGTVDLLVNNAADLRRPAFFDVDEAFVDYHLAANLRGPYLCADRAARIMREHRRGSIIHISSVGGLRAHLVGGLYDAAKGALDALTRSMAIELAPLGIRVNGVAPGATRSRPVHDPNHPQYQAWIGRIPLHRQAEPVEIGHTVAFLASNDAAYIIGQVLYVDGGITAQLSPPGQPL